MSLQKLSAQFGFDIDAKSVDAAINSVNSIDRQVSQVSRSVTKFVGLLGAGGIGAAIFSFAKGAVDEFAKEEQALARLSDSLSRLGITNKSVTKELEEFAVAQAKVSMATHDEIIEAERSLVTRGLWGEQLKKAIQASLDLATKTGSLSTATEVVGKAFQGTSARLANFGIAIDSNTPKAQVFGKVMEQINEHFGGAAQAQMGTYAGRLHIIGEETAELKERIGQELLPIFDYWAKKAGIVLDYLDKIAHSGPQTAGLTNYISALPELQTKLEQLNSSAAQYVNLQKEIPVALQEQINKQEKIIANTKAFEARKTGAGSGSSVATKAASIVGQDVEELKAEKKQQSEAQRKDDKYASEQAEVARLEKSDREKGQRLVENATMTQQEIQDVEENALIDRIRLQDGEVAANKVAQAKMTLDHKAQVQARLGYASTALGNFATLSNSKNKEIAKIGKAASISQAVVDTYGGATRAFKDVPWPWNFAVSASIIAAGMANVAVMTSRETGGPIDRTGPVNMHAGEYVLNKPIVDAIKSGSLPPQAGGGLARAGGGGVNITQNITLNGGGSDADIGALCQKIGEATRNGLRQAGEMANIVTKVGTKKAGINAL